MADPQYSFAQFLSQAKHSAGLTYSLHEGTPLPSIWTDGTNEEQTYRLEKFLAITGYVERHREDFDTGDIAVYGEGQVFASTALYRAVHQLFTAPDFNGTEPSPAAVLELLRRLGH